MTDHSERYDAIAGQRESVGVGRLQPGDIAAPEVVIEVSCKARHAAVPQLIVIALTAPTVIWVSVFSMQFHSTRTLRRRTAPMLLASMVRCCLWGIRNGGRHGIAIIFPSFHTWCLVLRQ